MDILWSVLLFSWFLIACGMLTAALFWERDQWGKGPTLLAVVMFAGLAFGIVNNYLGNQVIEGTVYAVSKTGSDNKVKIEFAEKLKTEIESSQEILQSYEVAIYPANSKKVLILNNSNNIWRLKFNKRDLQLGLQAGSKYRFRVHRRFFGKNILDFEPE